MPHTRDAGSIVVPAILKPDLQQEHQEGTMAPCDVHL